MYLPSNSIRAFPLGRPRSTNSNDITSRIFYEQTVSNIVKQLIDTNGFIISGSEINSNNGTLLNNLELNIGGYYFNILQNSLVFGLSTEGKLNSYLSYTGTIYIYFCIDLTSQEPKEIIGQDILDQNSNLIYQGLVIEASNATPDNFSGHTYCLPVFYGNVTNGIPNYSTWTIYNNSYFKFSVNSLDITGIDGLV